MGLLDKAKFPRLMPRRGGWLPLDHKHLLEWTKGVVDYVDRNEQTLNPTLQDFKDFIENNPTIRQLFTLMFTQIPCYPPYNLDPTSTPQIRDYKVMLDVFNVLMTKGPSWMYSTDGQKGLVGFPFNAVLDWPMGTAAGVAAFTREDVNEHFKMMLTAWSEFLTSPESVSVLTSDKDGWFNDEALAAMAEVASEANPNRPLTFDQAFVCDKSKPSYGYTSWDDFFIRHFREGVRPTEYPNESRVITSACESCPYELKTGVQGLDDFWIKTQPYSLSEMLNHDELAPQFYNGTVYQAFLSALSYHRWHSPVTGTIKKIVHIPGTYYAENYWEGFANPNLRGPDPAAPNNSQAYLCEVATRSLIFIESNEPLIGLMAVLVVGMAEVSSCEVLVHEGQAIKKGEELGMFHFGGSTHCLIFRPEVNLAFVPKQPFDHDGPNVPVNSALAVVYEGKAKNEDPLSFLQSLTKEFGSTFKKML